MDNNFKWLLNQVQGLHIPWEIRNRNKVTPYSHFLPHFSHQPLKKNHCPVSARCQEVFCLKSSVFLPNPTFPPWQRVFSRRDTLQWALHGHATGEKQAGEGAAGLRMNPVSDHEKVAKAARKYPGQRHMETPHSCDGHKSAAEDTTRDDSPGAPNQPSQWKRAFKVPKCYGKTSWFPCQAGCGVF